MEKVNILIIGAGAVGLAIANELSKEFDDVVLVEKEKSFGRHTSSRNSEVIHSGIYYPKDSLKATLCVDGNGLLYQYCAENEIPCRKTGKLIVASSENEIEQLEVLREKGRMNGVTDLQILGENKVNELEPEIKAKAALLVPSTGILDTHKFMQKLEKQTEDNDGFIVYDMEVTNIEKQSDNTYIITFKNGEKFQANFLINSAGLYSDRIAELAGIDIIEERLKLYWCKGEYFKFSGQHNIEHLVYPLPDPDGIYLGIHLTPNLNNEIRFGPSAYYIDKLTYAMDETYKQDFLEAANKYFEVNEDNLHPDDTGIRPKLQGPGDGFRDFYINEESSKGLPNLINLIGIESPGLTCCLSIGKHVKQILKRRI
jgi:L-2-hydroxyglutarate oxidase LhgO